MPGMKHRDGLVPGVLRRAWRHMRQGWQTMHARHTTTLVDHYKGMEIHIHTHRFGQGAWRCSIHIFNAPHRVLRTVAATLRIHDHGITQQSALTFAFMEAMHLCDLLLETSLP